MKDLLLEKFESSVLVQKETSQILGGADLESETRCTVRGDDGTYDTITRDYSDSTTTESINTDCDS